MSEQAGRGQAATDVDALILSHLDGSASEVERAALREMLRSMPEVADRFVALSMLHEDLHAVHEDELAFEVARQSRAKATTVRARSASFRRARARRIATRTGPLAVAAALLIAAGLLLLLGSGRGGREGPREAARPRPRRPDGVAIGRAQEAPAAPTRAREDRMPAKYEPTPVLRSTEDAHADEVDLAVLPPGEPDDRPAVAVETPAPPEVAEAPAAPSAAAARVPEKAEEAREEPRVRMAGVAYEVTGLTLRRGTGEKEDRVLRSGQGVLEGERITTQRGRVSVSLRNGAWLYVDRRTQLVMESVDGPRIRLTTGSIFIRTAEERAPRPPETDRLVVATPFGRVIHTGTRFGVTHKISTEVAVIEGSVKVENDAGSLTLGPRQGARLITRKIPPRGPLPVSGTRYAWALEVGAPSTVFLEEDFESAPEGGLPKGWKLNPYQPPETPKPRVGVTGPKGRRRIMLTHEDAHNKSYTELIHDKVITGPHEVRARVRMAAQSVRTGLTAGGTFGRWGVAIFACYQNVGTNYRLRFYHPAQNADMPPGTNQCLTFSKRYPRNPPGLEGGWDTLGCGMSATSKIFPVILPDVWYHMAFRIEPKEGGTLLLGKVWAEGRPEPKEWQLRQLDTEKVISVKGRIGFYIQRCGAEIDDVTVW